MTKNPVVSVLMPVYNSEKYVAEAVESVLAQTFGNFEFLIIDDGSSDGSLAILKRYKEKDQRICLVNRPNTGYVVALNEMLVLAQGKYIARMDSDDVALPERFSRQVEFLESNSGVVCVGGSFELIDEKGRLLTCLEPPQSNDDIQKLLLAGHSSICHPCTMMCRQAVIDLGGYNESMMPTEDLDLWLRLGEVGALANLKDKVLKYRLHMYSVSAQTQKQQRNKAREACEQAWRRRGIEGHFEAAEQWRPGSDRLSQHNFMLQYGWWAFNSSQRQTAIVYGTRAITTRPFAVGGWKLLACAAIKRLPPRSYQW